ncbi:MAG TPA: HAD family hydrolase, partial [Reyranella sp.]
MQRRSLMAGLAAIGWLRATPAFAQTDPLPSWNEGPVKRAILDFVPKVTTAGNRDFVPMAERIACFDNDGTLWTEQPNYFQVIFATDRVKALAARHPEWKALEPFKWVIEDNRDALAAMGEKGMLEIMVATHSGLTTEEFRQAVLEWLATARHPRFKRPYTDLIYQPMLELMAFLRANQFKTFIVSGGGIEFMRPWTEKAYGIPPEQVVGSSVKTRFEMRNGKPALLRLPELNFNDDQADKPVGINQHI